MATKRKRTSESKTNAKKSTSNNQGNKSVAGSLARKGVKTSSDFAAVMSAMISDILDGRVSSQTANAACNAAGKLLGVVEMRHKYVPLTKNGVLRLTA